MYRQLFNKILSMIKQAVYYTVDNDDTAYPKGIEAHDGNTNIRRKSGRMDKITSFTRMSIYGICSNPPVGSHILLMNSQGRESVKFGFINDFLNRKKNLKEGEVALVNTKTGTSIYLKENGEIDILNATAINFIGTVNITGDIIADGISLKTHTHGGVEPGAGNTSIPQ
jgi:phage gp45-like